MVEIVGLGFWVLGHGNRFVDRWVWVSCSFSVRNSSKKKNRSIVVVVLVLRLRLREALSGSAFFATSHTVSLQDHEEEPVLATVLAIASRPRGRTSLRWWRLALSPPTPLVPASR